VEIDGEIHDVPLAPILGLLALTLFWLLEFWAVVIHFASHGSQPTAFKLWLLSGMTAVATVYKLTLRRRHKVYDKFIRTGPRLKLSNFHSWAVVSMVLCYVVFATWILMP
jgi:hypothetical protein